MHILTHSFFRYLLNFKHLCVVPWASSSLWEEHYKNFHWQAGSGELHNLLIIWNLPYYLILTAVQ